MNVTNPQPEPRKPGEDQTFQPQNPDVEVNPTRPDNTEVDLDTQKTQTYPETNPQTLPPERH